MDSREERTTTPPSVHMPRAAKVGHKKSRFGCQRCKARRVKCDEVKPVCGSCQRHGAECTYPDMRSTVSPDKATEGGQSRRRSRVVVQEVKSPSPTADLFPRSLQETEDPEIPESKARRLMELRLMQNNLLNGVTGPPKSDRASPEWLELFSKVMPALSLEHDNVLYSTYALSATHLLRTNQDDEALYSARQNYLILALREQRRECASITAVNADAVCLCSTMILRNSLAMMQERDLDPYTPPTEWLRMGRGAGAVMWKASAAVQPQVPAAFKIFLDAYQHVLSEQALQRELDAPFERVWATICSQNQDPKDLDAYRKSLAYINSMQRAVEHEEPTFIVGRRLQAFPIVIPTRFADLVEQGDDLALVVLAHYFGVAAQIDREFWWLTSCDSGENGCNEGRTEGRTAMREIRAIDAHVGVGARALMLWPLMKVELGRT